MTKTEQKYLNLINLIVIITGTIYFLYKFFMVVDGEYGVRPHPFTSSLLHTHIILVPIMVFIFGVTFNSHVLPKLMGKSKSKKRSGIFLLSFFVVMTLTGYLLQVGFDLKSSTIIGYIHIGIAALWSFFFFFHSKLIKA